MIVFLFASCFWFHSINSVRVSPAVSSVSAGLSLQLAAIVDTTAFANKAVVWSVTQSTGDKGSSKVTVDQNGLVKIPADYDISKEAPQVKIRATSVYDSTKYGEATITVL